MNELIELFGIINSGRITRPEKINPFDAMTEAISHKFYNGLSTGLYANDDEAMEAIYGPGVVGIAAKGIRHKYDMLKKRLKERIFTAVLFPGEGKYPTTGYAGAFLRSYRTFITGRILLFFGAGVSGKRLINKVLARAMEFEIYDVALLSVIALRRQMAPKGNIKEFAGYKNLLEEFQQKIAAETAIESIYYDLQLPFATKLFISPSIVYAVAAGLQKAGDILRDNPTFRVRNVYYDILILDCQVRGDLMLAAKTCDKAINVLESNKKMYSAARHGTFLVKKMDSLLVLNQRNMVFECAEQCLKIYLPGTHNWYIVQELLFLAEINEPTSPLKDAINTYTICIKHSGFKTLETPDQEKWHIYGGYLWFVLTFNNKQEEREAIFGKRKSFDITTLSNKISVMKPDKKGVFVSFNILKTLIYLQEHKRQSLERSIVSLRNYLSFNLRGDNGRGRNFINLLIALVENEGKLHENTKQIKKLANALTKTERTITATQLQIEVISYSKLWKMAEGMIKKWR